MTNAIATNSTRRIVAAAAAVLIAATTLGLSAGPLVQSVVNGDDGPAQLTRKSGEPQKEFKLALIRKAGGPSQEY